MNYAEFLRAKAQKNTGHGFDATGNRPKETDR